jgi:hypothetical protein
MKITIDKKMKVELLKAIQTGVLDTVKIEPILKEIRGKSEFLELMKEATSTDTQETK